MSVIYSIYQPISGLSFTLRLSQTNCHLETIGWLQCICNNKALTRSTKNGGGCHE